MHDQTADAIVKLRGRSLADVMHEQPPNYLFENCFRDASITVLEAAPHRGKTLLMLDMALCLDMEMPLFERFAPLRGRKVFFLGCDAPAWDYGLQSRKLCIGHGLDVAHRNMLGVHGVWRDGLLLTDPAVEGELDTIRRSGDADVLFIDDHRSTHTANENDSQQMRHVWAIIKRMRNSGWTIIMAHHTAIPSGEAVRDDVHAGRGSSVIGASADFIYVLSKRNRKDSRVRVSCTKGRGAAEEDDPFTFFDITPVPSDEMVNGRPLYGIKLVASTEDALGEIVAALKTKSMNRSELGEHLKAKCPKLCATMSAPVLYRFCDNRLQELRQLNKVRIVERGVWAAL